VGSLAACPLRGAETSDTTAHAILNEQKRTVVTAGSHPSMIDFNAMVDLQSAAESIGVPMGQHSALDRSQRDRLHGLVEVSGTKIGEGAYVQLVAYITDDKKNPRFNTGESVNCYLTKAPNNDMHINVVADPEDEEFDGIVVEMVPQKRPSKWSLAAVRAVRDAHRQVLIRGILFFDNMHVKRTQCAEGETHATCVDPTEDAAGNPARESLWEIHPVSTMLVCANTEPCDPKKSAQWTPLQDVDLKSLKVKGSK